MSQEKEMVLNNKILQIKVGSHLYGTNTEDSDIDYSGIFIADKRYYLGLDRIDQVDLSSIDKNKDNKNTKDAIDFKIYEIKKFVKLALENNPNIIEQLFVNSTNIIFQNKIGKKLLDNRYLFLHKGLKEKFIGYALSQRKKMIVKLENYDIIKEAYDILESSDCKFLVDEKQFFKFRINPTDIRDERYFVGDIFIPRNITIKRAKQILQTRLGRVGHRQELILKHGFDCKFGSHLIRLLREGMELLSTGDLQFPLQYRDQILDIKNGKWKLKDVLEYSEQLDDEINTITNKSELRSKSNYNEVNKLLINIIEDFI